MRVKGGAEIRGSVTVSGNKNAALPMIAALLLAEEECVLRNVPDILDVRTMLDIAGELQGGECLRRLEPRDPTDCFAKSGL